MMINNESVDEDYAYRVFKIDNIYAGNQQLMQRWRKLFAEMVSRNKVKEKK